MITGTCIIMRVEESNQELVTFVFFVTRKLFTCMGFRKVTK